MPVFRAFVAVLGAYRAASPPTRRRAWIALVSIPLAVGVMLGVLAWQLVENRRTAVALHAALTTRVAIEHVRVLVTDAESAQRGYLLTGDEGYLTPYFDARAGLQALTGTLTSAFLTSAAQSARLVTLTGTTGAKFDELGETIARKRNKQSAEALNIVESDNGRRLMDRMRSLLAQMGEDQRVEIAALLRRQSAIQNTTTLALGALLAGLTLLLASVSAFLFRIVGDLVERKAQAELANRSKSAFLAMMSHELRTPMNGVLGMAHMLEQGNLTVEQAAQVNVLQVSGRGLMVVLNDILDLSKIEADRIDLEIRTFDVASQVKEAADLWRPSAEAKDIGLTVDVTAQDDATVFSGDPTRIRQIIANLISNAVKFTAKGGVRVHLVIGAQEPDGRRPVAISVSDTGSGISEETAKRLFAPFTQADSSVTRQYGGTGLGLAISRKLARLMGGDVTLASRVGCGSTFSLELLLAPSVAETSDDANATELADLSNLRILVAEDNPHNQAVVRAYLHALGVTAEVVDNGAQALQALRRGTFDLVLMDVQMPVLDGIEATAAVRRGDCGDSAMPIIALTADAMAGDRERFLARGFDDHIAKPIDPRSFVTTISRTVRTARLRQASPTARAA